jgi:hypothetical protein
MFKFTTREYREIKTLRIEMEVSTDFWFTTNTGVEAEIARQVQARTGQEVEVQFGINRRGEHDTRVLQMDIQPSDMRKSTPDLAVTQLETLFMLAYGFTLGYQKSINRMDAFTSQWKDFSNEI